MCVFRFQYINIVLYIRYSLDLPTYLHVSFLTRSSWIWPSIWDYFTSAQTKPFHILFMSICWWLFLSVFSYLKRFSLNLILKHSFMTKNSMLLWIWHNVKCLINCSVCSFSSECFFPWLERFFKCIISWYIFNVKCIITHLY